MVATVANQTQYSVLDPNISESFHVVKFRPTEFDTSSGPSQKIIIRNSNKIQKGGLESWKEFSPDSRLDKASDDARGFPADRITESKAFQTLHGCYDHIIQEDNLNPDPESGIYSIEGSFAYNNRPPRASWGTLSGSYLYHQNSGSADLEKVLEFLNQLIQERRLRYIRPNTTSTQHYMPERVKSISQEDKGAFNLALDTVKEENLEIHSLKDLLGRLFVERKLN